MRFFSRVSAVIAGVVLGAAVAAPAVADPGDLVCSGAAQVNFIPPLTGPGSTDIELVGALVNCESLNGQWTELDSATIVGDGEASATFGSPCSLLLNITGSGRLDWSPPEPDSHFDFTLNTDPAQGLATLNAEVTNGPLDGDQLIPVIVEVNPNPDCATAGLERLTSQEFEAAFA